MTESVTSLGVTEAPTAEGARPSIDLPIGASDPHLGVLARPHRDRCGRHRCRPGRASSSTTSWHPAPRARRWPSSRSSCSCSRSLSSPRSARSATTPSTRWGRRKPYIVFGALFDVVFLVGIATANSLVAIAAFVTLLALSTNIARGPFQGYVPDLVPDKQVGLASAMVGMFQVLGNVLGFALAAIATSDGQRRGGDRGDRRRRARDDAQRRPARPEGAAGQVARGSVVAVDRRRDVGYRHPPGEELHLDARLAPVHPHGRRGGAQLRLLLPRRRARPERGTGRQRLPPMLAAVDDR